MNHREHWEHRDNSEILFGILNCFSCCFRVLLWIVFAFLLFSFSTLRFYLRFARAAMKSSMRFFACGRIASMKSVSGLSGL